jgi:hypothetical protein
MPRRAITFDTVRRLARDIAGVDESGNAALKLHGKLLAWIPTNKSAEPHSLALRISPEDRDELIAAAPETYYVTDHYLGYNTVLVRLPCIQSQALQDLLRASHRFVARSLVKPAAKPRAAKPRTPKPPGRKPRSS